LFKKIERKRDRNRGGKKRGLGKKKRNDDLSRQIKKRKGK